MCWIDYCMSSVRHLHTVQVQCDTSLSDAVQSYVDILDQVLSAPVNAAPVPLPAAGSGPNGAVGIETFNMMPATVTAPANMAVPG